MHNHSAYTLQAKHFDSWDDANAAALASKAGRSLHQ
jgi:hypothetical protein